MKNKRGRWGDFKTNVSCYGFFHALLKELPCYYSLYNFYWAIRHRTTDRYHVVKLGEPNYYETYIKLLYAPFAILKDYIEGFTYNQWDEKNGRYYGELKGLKAFEHKIQSIYSSWEEDNKTGWKERELNNRYDYQKQINDLREAKRLYIWWTETFPTIEDRNPFHIHFDEMYPKEHPGFLDRILKEDSNGSIIISDDNIPKELQDLRSKYSKESMEYEIRMEEEITNNLISLMKIRNSLYDN
jgi:hypothetical protein